MAQKNQGNNSGNQGTGGNTGNGQGNEDDDDGTAGGLSAAARKEVEQLVGQTVNGAVTNHLTRFKKDMTETMGKTLAEALAPITEQLTQARKPPEDDGAGKGGKVALPKEYEDQLKKQQATIDQLLAENKATKESAEKERTGRLRDEERQTLTGALINKGFNPTAAKAAVALLHGEEQRISRDDSGKIVWKVTRGSGAGAYTDELDVEKGLGEWLATDEGKAMTPARQVNGSGNQPSRNQPGGKGNPNQAKQDAKAQATQDLAALLTGTATTPMG